MKIMKTREKESIGAYFDHSKSGKRGFSGDCYQIIQTVSGNKGKRISSEINNDEKIKEDKTSFYQHMI